MAGRAKMFGRVFVLRTVTAADVAADKAHPQIHPGVAGFYAVFANRDVLRMDILDLRHVCAGVLDKIFSQFHIVLDGYTATLK